MEATKLVQQMDDEWSKLYLTRMDTIISTLENVDKSLQESTDIHDVALLDEVEEAKKIATLLFADFGHAMPATPNVKENFILSRLLLSLKCAHSHQISSLKHDQRECKIVPILGGHYYDQIHTRMGEFIMVESCIGKKDDEEEKIPLKLVWYIHYPEEQEEPPKSFEDYYEFCLERYQFNTEENEKPPSAEALRQKIMNRLNMQEKETETPFYIDFQGSRNLDTHQGIYFVHVCPTQIQVAELPHLHDLNLSHFDSKYLGHRCCYVQPTKYTTYQMK